MADFTPFFCQKAPNCPQQYSMVKLCLTFEAIQAILGSQKDDIYRLEIDPSILPRAKNHFEKAKTGPKLPPKTLISVTCSIYIGGHKMLGHWKM